METIIEINEIQRILVEDVYIPQYFTGRRWATYQEGSERKTYKSERGARSFLEKKYEQTKRDHDAHLRVLEIYALRKTTQQA